MCRLGIQEDKVKEVIKLKKKSRSIQRSDNHESFSLFW